jgi:hypothetical protein
MRTTVFLIKNNMIDKKSQKAFLPGISGCTEHSRAMLEIVKTARIE